VRLRARARLAAAWLVALLPAGTASGIGSERLLSGLDQPVFVGAPAGDPRLFVAERGGRILVWDGTGDPGVYLDIASQVDTQGEGGLLGFAFPDDFETGLTFYVYYTAPSATATLESRISRFEVDDAADDQVDPSTETILFTLDQPFSNHNGGTLAIRDGYLYFGAGDGGSGGDPMDLAQDPSSLFGKLLRFDLAVGAVPWTPEVWARGFRNPFRFSFDRATGDLYVGDVGQSSVEEIDVEASDSAGGLNYGWDVLEGSQCFDPSPGEPDCDDPSLVLPVFEYEHEAGICEVGGSGTVTGGVVYRGDEIPSLQGQYFFADFCTDRIWTLVWDGAGSTVGDPVDRSAELAPDAGAIADVVAFGEDGFGELYIADIVGEVFRVVPEPGAFARWGAVLCGLAALARTRRR
jgi:glucose/arabinose dehydrogenase